MDLPTDVRALLTSSGFFEDADYNLPDDLNELSSSSVRDFINQTFLKHNAESSAFVHVTGPSVVGHSAPLRGIGEFMMTLQSAFDSIGASLEGFKALSGQIPVSVTNKTELALVASPFPGSVILEIAPSMSRLEDLYPKGEALFDVEKEIGAKPLADSAFVELSKLLGSLSDEQVEQDKFVEHLEDLGPRVASSVQNFCDVLDRNEIDVDFGWEEPSGERGEIRVSHSFAKYVSSVIKEADIHIEPVHIEGILVTVTTSEKDRLRIREDSGEGGLKETTLLIGDIPFEQIRGLQTGDRVEVDAERQITMRAGHRSREKLVGVRIQKVRRMTE